MHVSQVSIALFTFALLACGGEGGRDSNRNLDSRERDAAIDGASSDEDGGAADASERDAEQPELDGAAPDAELDGASPDAGETGAFSVTVRRGTALLANVPVIFHDATGAVLSQHETSVQGRVTSDSTPAMVTVLASIRPSRQQNIRGQNAITFTALAEGDQLVVDLPDPELRSGEVQTGYRLGFGAPPEGAYVAALAGIEGCANNQLNFQPEPPFDLLWPTNCPNPANNSLLLVAGAETGGVLGYAYVKGVPPFTAPQQPVSVGQFAEPAELTLTARNLPESISAQVNVGFWSEGVFFEPQREVRIPNWLLEGETTRTLGYPLPAGFAESVVAELVVSGPGRDQISTYTRRLAPASSAELDFAERQPGATWVELQGTDPQHPVLVWENEPAFVSADASIALVYAVVDVGAGYDNPLLSWLVIGPADSTQVALTASIEGFPFTVDANTIGSAITYVDGSLTGGYRGFLREPLRPADLADRFDTHPVRLQPSATGTVRAVTTRPPQST